MTWLKLTLMSVSWESLGGWGQTVQSLLREFGGLGGLETPFGGGGAWVGSGCPGGVAYATGVAREIISILKVMSYWAALSLN